MQSTRWWIFWGALLAFLLQFNFYYQNVSFCLFDVVDLDELLHVKLNLYAL